MGGTIALEVSLLAAVVVGVTSIAGARAGSDRRRTAWSRLSVGALVVAALALWWSVVALGRAFWRSDFQLAYVVDHSRDAGSGWYRLAGIWGGPEGSLLLWAALLAVIALIAVRMTDGVGRSYALAASAVLVGGTAAIVRWAADPFVTLDIPAVSGRGLTPILEHPAMLYHPIILYAGLLATTVPFLVTLAAWSNRRLDQTWAARVRSSVLVGAAVLALGLATGANWAYQELGWGGYWAWDPVENAALVPWLALVVAVHLFARPSTAGRPVLVAAATLPLAITLGGAALTRAGSTDSVHAFADDRTVGYGLAGLGAAVVAAALVMIVHQRTERTSPPGSRAWHPRMLAAVLLVAIAVVVAFGTGVPPVVDAVAGDRLVVRGGFYAWSAGPLAAVGLVLLAVVWARRRWWVPAIGALAGTAAVAFSGWWTITTAALLVAAGAALASVLAATAGRSSLPLTAAHAGAIILLVGVAGSTQTTESAVWLTVGDEAALSGERVTLTAVEVLADRPEGPRVVAVLDVADRGSTLRPALQTYDARPGSVLAETALDAGLARDLQVVLQATRDAEGPNPVALVQLRVRPLAGLIWLGAGLLVVGLLSAAIGRRRPALVVGRSSVGLATEGALPVEEAPDGRRGRLLGGRPGAAAPRR